MTDRDRRRMAAAGAVLLLAMAAPSAARDEPAATPPCAAPAQSVSTTSCGTPVRPDRPAAPDIFGSVALPVGSTPFDTRWHAVRAALTEQGERPWASIIGQVEGLERERQLQLINNWVNSHIAFAEDGRADEWESLPASFASRRGDCEDYAIAKMQLLEEAGLPVGDMYLVIVTDTANRKDHAILAVRDGGELLILDNRTDLILRSGQIADYRPIVSFSADFAWTHGYRSATPRRTMAQVQPGAKAE